MASQGHSQRLAATCRREEGKDNGNGMRDCLQMVGQAHVDRGLGTRWGPGEGRRIRVADGDRNEADQTTARPQLIPHGRTVGPVCPVELAIPPPPPPRSVLDGHRFAAQHLTRLWPGQGGG